MGKVIVRPYTTQVAADLGLGTKRLSTLADHRNELRRIYEALACGKLHPDVASKLAWMVNQMRVAKRDEVTTEIMEKGGIAGAPFAGMVLVGPREQDDGGS